MNCRSQMQPETRYARSGTLNLAYQVWGQGPTDVVLIPGFISHVEYAWEEPSLAGFLRRLSTCARVIAFDKRGMGLSDRDPDRATPDLEQRMADVQVVMDAAQSERACLICWSEGGPLGMLLAERHPQRVT